MWSPCRLLRSGGAVVCIPGLEDAALLERLTEIQRAIMMGGNRPTLARRYQPAQSGTPGSA